MKIKNLVLSICIVGITVFSGCGESKPKDTNQENAQEVQYQCPMKCEGEKTYDSEGKCPVCKMDLKKL
jgi:protein SCO1/2